MSCRFVLSISIRVCLLALFALGMATGLSAQDKPAPKPFNFEEEVKKVPTPKQIWPFVQKDMVPAKFRILSDEIVPSDTDPTKKFRKIRAHFQSIRIEGRTWGHDCVIFLPEDNSRNMTPDRRGKIVIVGSGGYTAFEPHVNLYGEPIAARTGYPTMVMSNPGKFVDDGSEIEGQIGILNVARKRTGKNYYNMNCQLAVAYIQAMNVMQEFLGVDTVHAVIGGHSKRGRSATVAAAMDSRVASVVILGNEGVFKTDRIEWHLSFHHAIFQDQVNVPVLFIGTTNEDGYKMFSINFLQDRLKKKMTLEMIPNYRHFNFHEKQFIDFLMWVSHTFDNRPITTITDITHERQKNRTVFRAKIAGGPKVRIAQLWYVFSTNPNWYDEMWYELVMRPVGDHYEASLHGTMPDAFIVEVADIANGIPGYVSSVPHKITDAPVLERHGTGFHPLWKPVTPPGEK